jgi:catechol 2,3-dioxygenase
MSDSDFKLAPQLKVGPVCLRTKNLDDMLSFYERDFGFKVIRSDGGYTSLGDTLSSEPIIILHEDKKASQAPPGATGLYHYALLMPDRRSLAAAYVSLGNKGVVFDGYADHQVSEALYLNDPEGNGIEIYSDRPREKWKFDEDGVEMTTQPLNLDSLLAELPGRENKISKAMVDGAKIGHIHLKVSALQTSLVFYRDALGFETMRYWGDAAFLSAGCYHHHIGMNTWESLGGPAASKAWIGLEHFALTIAHADLNQLSQRLALTPVTQENGAGQLLVSDPDDINLIFRSA